jgi:glyoxylase I family protein
MKLARVHHVSLNVSDLEAAQTFYTDVLEMPLLDRPDFPFRGAWLDAGEQQVHLIEIADFEAPEGQHVAFQVADLAATASELTARGVEVTTAREIDGVCLQAFFSDPTGNLTELNQPL